MPAAAWHAEMLAGKALSQCQALMFIIRQILTPDIGSLGSPAARMLMA
jgi:hypothetical protein